MTPDDLHDMFFAAAGVAGALIGLLFVAISVEHDRLTSESGDQVARVRARAALTAFISSLTVSLFALVPGNGLALSGTIVGVSGLLFTVASVLSVRRVRHATSSTRQWLRELSFLVAPVVVFIGEIIAGIHLLGSPHDSGPADTLAELVIFSFLIGIYRSWQLVGGPDIGLGREVREIVAPRRRADPEGDD